MLFISFFNKNTVLLKILGTFSFLMFSVYHLAVPAGYESHEEVFRYAQCTSMLNVWHMANSVCLESSVAAKLASKKAVLLLLQFRLSVGLREKNKVIGGGTDL